MWIIPLSFIISYITFLVICFFSIKKVSNVDKDSIEYKISKLSKKELRIELKNKIDLIEELEQQIDVLEDLNLSLIHDILKNKGDK